MTRADLIARLRDQTADVRETVPEALANILEAYQPRESSDYEKRNAAMGHATYTNNDKDPCEVVKRAQAYYAFLTGAAV